MSHHGVVYFSIEALPGPGVIKLEYSLKVKIKRNDWLLADTCPQAANHYVKFENKLKFNNLRA